MEEYNYIPNLQTFSIIDPAIVLNSFVIYHGTSAAYSTQIEANGLVIGHLPLGRDALKKTVQYLEELPGDLISMGLVSRTINAINVYLNEVNSISASLVGYAAVQYATAPVKGGQIIMLLLDNIQAIKKLFNQLPDNYERKSEMIKGFVEISTTVETHCANIAEADGVVYLIQARLNMLPQLRISSNVLFLDRSVEPGHIIGKVIIPAGTIFESDQSENINRTFMKKIQVRDSIGFRLTEPDDDEMNLEN